ncbi:DNA N-6-adenine-methyltransferase [Mycobacteroides abscessus]|uniref:DNA N-6-adenine-methyltransferase n=1 Tax=Mycobacteroides abscessus TaxID=36809 RepID=UPI0002318511|nr:DNA N-6-adenine-methyltransferase [Mycobacteroides abscessus]QSM04436.1 methyltransferase [Mycobacterium phage prophiGD02-2]QST87299.1 methyltransferase [Mycobacterium phage prophiGD90-1]EHB98846.1 phage N-6-adenine-methyltransferase [Mycobacteroides abscessus 47J26]MDE9371566.1 DNA N-6-adenine-methyltransferase [Mycobacteroides abscessus subsp. bolletii]MDM2097043.1 DNA N-6-adenine-methyltransferase [Mycobacteroides abscessus]
MSLVRFKAKNHRQQVEARGGVDSPIDDRATTPADFARFDTALGPFTVDVAAAAHNAKCARYFTFEINGLTQSWAGERVWCNPPYSRIGAWVEKAWREHERTDGIAMLLPANRTEQGWWQQMVEPYRDRSVLSVLFLPGRMRFIAAGSTQVGPNERPPFGCCLLTWGLDNTPLRKPDLTLFDLQEEA